MRACGLVRRDGRLLLQRKRHEAIWALPGGRVEPGETPEAALLREFQEELGWQVSIAARLWQIENVFTHHGEDVRQTEICFAVSCDAQLTVKDETLEFRWISPVELHTLDVRPEEVRRRLAGS
ncbi:NUDIX domain-containing protein [Aestuariivirga litoralis]|nr:NUDIX domain-containing protein [Aestuariivirga litoralis]